jgi:hypothetical protein
VDKFGFETQLFFLAAKNHIIGDWLGQGWLGWVCKDAKAYPGFPFQLWIHADGLEGLAASRRLEL